MEGTIYMDCTENEQLPRNLSEFSINTNLDEFVLVGGRPQMGPSGDVGSIRSMNTATCEKLSSVFASTDFLDFPAEGRSRTLSRSSAVSHKLCRPQGSTGTTPKESISQSHGDLLINEHHDLNQNIVHAQKSTPRTSAPSYSHNSIRQFIKPGKTKLLASIFENAEQQATVPPKSAEPKHTPVFNFAIPETASVASEIGRISSSSSNSEICHTNECQDDVVNIPMNAGGNKKQHSHEPVPIAVQHTVPVREFWAVEYGLDDALLVADDDSFMTSLPQMRTSTPLNEVVDSRIALAAQFSRIPSIRADGIEQHLGHGNGGAASHWEKGGTDTDDTRGLNGQQGRDLGDINLKIYGSDATGSTISGAPRYGHYISPRQKQSMLGEETMNGHIDQLFDFQELENPMRAESAHSIRIADPPHRGLRHSMSTYRSFQRAQLGRPYNPVPRFSPASVPYAGQVANPAIALGSKWSTASSDTNQGDVISASLESPRTARSRHMSSNNDGSHLTDGEHHHSKTRNEILADYTRQIERHQHHVAVTVSQLGMLQKAVSQAKRDKKPIAVMHTQRSLLLARERIGALERENKRLQHMVETRRTLPPLNEDLRASVTIASISAELNKNFTKNPDFNEYTYGFMVVLKCNEEVAAMAPVLSSEAVQNGRHLHIHFKDQVNFGHLHMDYTILLEVLAMALPNYRNKEQRCCAANFANKCRNFVTGRNKQHGIPIGEWFRCGYTVLSRDTKYLTSIYLDGAEYPLEGTVEVYTRTSTLPPKMDINHTGFLTMGNTVVGTASWERYWAVLRQGGLSFWKFPDDERERKKCSYHVDISSCVRDRLTACSSEECPRPHTFRVDVHVSTSPSVMTKRRILLSADSREEMEHWLEVLNQTLQVIRG